MRQWILLCLIGISYFSLDVFAVTKAAKLNPESSLLTFHLEPAAPKVGEKLSLFIQAGTSVSRNELVIEASLDEVPVKLTNTGAELWAATFKEFSEIKTHQINVNIFVRDSQQASRVRFAINQLKQEINALNSLIDQEPDLTKKTALEAERDQKQSYSDELDVSLDNLKSFLKSESYEFQIASDPANANYPLLVSVSPNTAPLAKRIRVVLSGNNFPANPNVKIGGLNSTIISAGVSSIEVLAPNFSITGAKNIEITFPAVNGEPKKSTVLGASFFASDRAVLKNLRPVAVTTGYQKVTWPVTAPVALQAENSYDENGDQFSYEWTFQKVPTGSSFTQGDILADSATPSFTPDKIGIYTLKLRLLETITEEMLTSFTNTVTVEVK